MTPQPSPTIASPTDPPGPLPTATPSPTATPTETLVGAAAELAALLESIESTTFLVVFERTGPPELAGNKIKALNSSEGSRVDSIPPGQEEAATALIEESGADQVISCQGGPDSWSCTAVEPLGQPILRTALPFVFFPASELKMYIVQEVEGRLLAGEQSSCFEVEAPEEDIIEYCFTSDGIPVYSSPVFGTYEAVEISRSIPGDALLPPAPVK